MTTLETFAAQYRLRITRDAYNARIVEGQGRSLIADFGAGRLSVLLMGSRAQWWKSRRKALLAAGARLEQDGSTEGSLSFEPANTTACLAAIKAVGCRKQRRITANPSPAQLAARERFTTMARDSTRKRAAAAQTDDLTPGIPEAHPGPSRSL